MGSPNVSIRVNRTSGYTAMSTHHLRNPQLSLKAKGLLSSLLASPPGWSASVAGYVATCKDGKAAVTAALKELEEAGYVVRQRKHDDKGRFLGMEYIVHELPQNEQCEPFTENRQMDATEESAQPFTDFPSAEKPSTEKPAPENRPQYNIKEFNIKEYNPPKAPKGAGSQLFAKFWSAYPKKKAKQNAAKAWEKADVTVELFGTIMRALDQDKRSDQWTRDNGRYIPYPATWLNAKRWEDEPDVPVALPVPENEARRRYRVT